MAVPKGIGKEYNLFTALYSFTQLILFSFYCIFTANDFPSLLTASELPILTNPKLPFNF